MTNVNSSVVQLNTCRPYLLEIYLAPHEIMRICHKNSCFKGSWRTTTSSGCWQLRQTSASQETCPLNMVS